MRRCGRIGPKSARSRACGDVESAVRAAGGFPTLGGVGVCARSARRGVAGAPVARALMAVHEVTFPITDPAEILELRAATR